MTDAPAYPGQPLSEVLTPALIVDLDALDHNLARMARLAKEAGVRLRPHGKMHKSADLARLQMAHGAVGLCCQKVSEAEAFARAGVTDLLVTNEVRGAARIARLTALAATGAHVGVCVDDPANVPELSSAITAAGATLDVYVERDIGQGRCGVTSTADVVTLARAIDAAPGLSFAGLQAYHGNAQHLPTHAERSAAIDAALPLVAEAVSALRDICLPPPQVTGAGSGTFPAEAASGLYTELQCGSYAVLDVDYARLLDANDSRYDATWRHAVFVLTEVMSVTRPGLAVLDAGHKAHAIDSGLPVIADRPDLRVTGASDEHTTVDDPASTLAVGDRLRLIPGHCDPTFNLHDWIVACRGDTVAELWPVTARGCQW
ncbi:DSD1 family PLP-dependent enzyme [Pseudaestuariivita atlantica]|uniref:Alanine racemase n=1 Tax=Pseudaestuariivita atlantica TaxID=1317121 RepID=A0A0L1JQ57_9RHOB|nr:DSD1 family PLP-dependent enzyme [Pseudaestuariivita atlantica]KNG93871.1 alanine racemase [Pseudaestuariivita atlantica]